MNEDDEDAVDAALAASVPPPGYVSMRIAGVFALMACHVHTSLLSGGPLPPDTRAIIVLYPPPAAPPPDAPTT
jgi:hypothetical protein